MKRRSLRISRRDFRCVLIFATLATIVSSTVAYTTLVPRPSERFFAMWILGSKGLAEDYYPNDNPNLKLAETVNWTLGVYNHMSGLEYVLIRVRLLNSTLAGPDELTGNPSPVPAFFEFARVLLDNETWTLPFVWKLTNMTQIGSRLTIMGILVNQTPLTRLLGTALLGYNFRLIFELWFYDEDVNNLVFSQYTDGVRRFVWTQVWFNATLT